MSTHRLLRWFLFVLILPFGSAGCAAPPLPAGSSQPWSLNDLRVLEPAEADLNPAYDLVAAYDREAASDLELRFDLLGTRGVKEYDIYLALDTAPGGDTSLLPPGVDMEWDLLIRYPARGLPGSRHADGTPSGLRPRIERMEVQDAYLLRLAKTDLAIGAATARYAAWVALPGETTALDTIGPAVIGGPARRASAPLLIAFWDALPAATPAQALRRWDGAHTGPFGQRHGLGVLLRAAQEQQVPVTLLDLKQPESLSALDALGGLELAREMEREGLLSLPEDASSAPELRSTTLQVSIDAAETYRLPDSPLVYMENLSSIPVNAKAAFTHLDDPTHVQEWDGRRYIPLPVEQDDGEEWKEGLPAEERTALLNAAVSSDPADIVVLGGALPGSPWGDSLVSGAAFAWIAGHPWITPLDEDALQDLPAAANAPACVSAECAGGSSPAQQGSVQQSAAALEGAVGNGLFVRLARQAALQLSAPTSDAELAALRANYLGITGLLLAADRWQVNPLPVSDCSADLDWDGSPECVLASTQMFLIIDPHGGRLELAAELVGRTPLLISAPRSLFAAGLGDRFDWKPEAGISADPQEIPGGFSDPGPASGWTTYTPNAQPSRITLTDPASGSVKSFFLAESGFRYRVEGQAAAQAVQLPLALLDTHAYSRGWLARYRLEGHDGLLEWEIDGGPRLEARAAGAQVSAYSFADQYSALSAPEDPNMAFGPGHFLPFPLALAVFAPDGSSAVEVDVRIVP